MLTFETNRLTLRPFELDDAATVQVLAGVEEVASPTLSIPHPYPDGAAEAWIETTHQFMRTGDRYALAIVRKEDGDLIGNVTLGVTLHHKRAELGYWIGKPYWGHGYATEAAQRMLQFGFEELELNRIYAAAMARNPASNKVMEKIGMKYEGTFPQHVIKSGVYEDLVYFGMVRSDYVPASMPNQI